MQSQNSENHGIERRSAVVIGGGPAGLMAAEQLALGVRDVLVLEAKPSFARKFLMAGKSGLNITKDEPLEELVEHYGPARTWLKPILANFDAAAVQKWARDLDQDLFIGSTGRVFPTAMKASPLLRSWFERLDGLGVERRTRWRWCGWEAGRLTFETPGGKMRIDPEVTVLALGGASWARLGSDGLWAACLREKGVELAPFNASNAALSLEWSAHMAPHFGSALKSVAWHSNGLTSRGEAILSSRGLEGGGLYALTPALREGARLYVDLMPDVSLERLAQRLPKDQKKARLGPWLKKVLKLPAAKVALFNEMTACASLSPVQWPEYVKSLQIKNAELRPMDEAISTAGGVHENAVNENLMLSKLPGVFCAGEMLNWEAPTGGYLLTGCFATGRHAGQSALSYLQSLPSAAT